MTSAQHIKWTTIFTIRRLDVRLRIRNDESVEKKMISIEQSDANKAMKQKEKRINCSIILGLISAYFVTLQVPELSQSGSSICTIAPPPPLLFHILYLVGWEYLPVRCMGTNGVTSHLPLALASHSLLPLLASGIRGNVVWPRRSK